MDSGCLRRQGTNCTASLRFCALAGCRYMYGHHGAPGHYGVPGVYGKKHKGRKMKASSPGSNTQNWERLCLACDLWLGGDPCSVCGASRPNHPSQQGCLRAGAGACAQHSARQTAGCRCTLLRNIQPPAHCCAALFNAPPCSVCCCSTASSSAESLGATSECCCKFSRIAVHFLASFAAVDGCLALHGIGQASVLGQGGHAAACMAPMCAPICR
jgi:hypothetical protein